MIVEHNGTAPIIDPTARIAPNATICGDVTIGARTSVGFGTVVTAESGPVTIGEDCVIMDNAVLRGTKKHELTIGDNCLVGPHAYLCGCKMGDNVFSATGTSIFNDADVGDGSMIRINAVVHIKTRLEPHAVVPIGCVAVGDPANILPTSEFEAIWSIQQKLEFMKTVFGVDAPSPGQTIMPEIMPRYARMLGQHRDDVEITPSKPLLGESPVT